MDRPSVNRAAQVERWGERVLDVLAPSWRWMYVIVGCALLYCSIRAISPAAGILDTKLMLLGFVMTTAGLAALFWATRPAPPAALQRWWDGLPDVVRWRGWAAIITVWLLIASWSSFRDQWRPLVMGHYPNDAIAYVHEDADLLIRGQNPYTDDNAFWEAATRWPHSLATPLLGSTRFGNKPLHYPLGTHIGTVLQYELHNPAARSNDFDPATIHNYPAGVVLLAAPFVWAGLHSVIWLNFAMLALLIGVIVAHTPRASRLSMLVALLANPLVPMFTLFMNFDVVSLVFVVLAWQWMQRRPLLSAVAMGVACAVKQVAWFFAPFYLIEVLRRDGWRAAAKQGAVMGAAFLVPNLPFIVQGPAAWLHSIMIPMADPMYPLGFGPIILMLGKALPLLPPTVWTVLEMGTWLGLLVYQLRRKEVTSDGLIFALLPLWMSWRSPMNYFALLPMLVLWLTARMGTLRKPAALDDGELVPLSALDLHLDDLAPSEPELIGAN